MDHARAFIESTPPPSQHSSSLRVGIPVEDAVAELTGLRATPSRHPDHGRVSFKLGGASTQHISYPRHANRSLADLSLAILHLCGIPAVNQKFIFRGRHFQLGEMSENAIASISLRDFDRRTIMVMGSRHGGIRDPRALEEIYFRLRIDMGRDLSQGLTSQINAATLRRARLAAGTERRPTPPPVNRRHAEDSGYPRGRVFGFDVHLPGRHTRDAASALLGAGIAPKFECAHQAYDDLYEGLECRRCTERWVVQTFLFVSFWLQCRATFYAMRANSEPPNSAQRQHSLGRRDATLRTLEQINREWSLRVPRWGTLIAALDELNEILDFEVLFDRDELIRARDMEKDDIQREAFSLISARHFIHTYAAMEASGRPTGLFTGRYNGQAGGDPTAANYSELVRRVNDL